MSFLSHSLSAVALVVFSSLIGCDGANLTVTQMKRTPDPAGTTHEGTVRVISNCPVQSCEALVTRDIVFVPEDGTHCSIECCSGDFGCSEQYIPWINKATGKTDKWYDVYNRKMLSEIPSGN